MLDQFLGLEFLWFPKPEELPDLEELISEGGNAPLKPSGPLLKLKTSISSFCGFPVFVKDCKKRNEVPDSSTNDSAALTAENSLFHLDFLYNVLCTVKLERNQEEDFRKFVNLFCSTKQGKLQPDVYLKIDPSIFPSSEKIDTTLTHIEIEKFSLGNLVGLGTFVERFNSKSSLENEEHKITQARLQMLHDEKKMLLYFVVGRNVPVKKRDATTHLFHKLVVNYSSLHSIIVSKSKNLIIYFKMISPPLLYSVEQEQDSEVDYISFFDISPRTSWFRAVDLVKGGPSRMRKEFSMNTVLRLEFKFTDQDYDFLFQLLPHCSGVQLFFSPIFLRIPDEKVVSIVPKFDASGNNEDEQFECHYALQCILTRSYEVLDQVHDKTEAEELKCLLQKGFSTSSHALKESLYLIFEALNKGVTLDFKHCLKFLLNRLKGQEPSASAKNLNGESSHLVLIKRALLTPTHLVLQPPRLTLQSRALRDCSPGYSLRVIIRDVHNEVISQSVRSWGPNKMEKQRNFFDVYFKYQLLRGFKIEKREYRYVGSSTSQLKGHGLWFYAEDHDKITAEKLRAGFGQLAKIKEVPRYMARMGQTFSQSMGNVPVPQEWTNVNNPEPDVTGGVKEYLVIPDSRPDRKKKHLKTIEDSDDDEEQKEEEDEEKEPYTFSDGVGRISPELADEVYKKLDVEKERPSAMQIRYAGCKGMLVVDPSLVGKKILFRKSMVKFGSNHESLEILKFSEKRSLFLNRPLITILEGLGIGRGVFLRLQKEMIQNHISSMFHERYACDFLHRHSLLRFDFISMLSANIKFTEDPLFRSMIFSLFKKQIELLKDKANIEIPVDMGRNMFGVMDDTFTLEYGEIFVQYSDWKTDEPHILLGTVVVTKNPCMHPGDVRKFTAVDVKGLHHIRDCIVFPAKGPRPHPDEMAGSDLDGDEYHVMWCEEMIFPLENVKPMHFAQKKNKGDDKVKCPVQISDELDHFREFIFHDNVGVIANAHLAWADQEKEGVHSQVCLLLAALYSISLDFAKTGKGVTLGQYTALKVPDFMQKLSHKKTYLSKKSLGVLFRNCKRLELGVDSESNNKDFRVDNDLIHEEWRNYEKSAKRLLKWYRNRIEFFLRSFGFENEGQLLAGALFTPPTCIENRHDLQNILALLEFQVPLIFKDLNKRFYNEFEGKPKDGRFTDAMLQKASAWYMVTYSSSAESGSKYPVFGFPWAVHEVLVALKNTQHSASAQVHPTDGRTLLETIIDQSVASRLPADLGPSADTSAIHAGRLQVLDVSMKILERWIKTQRDYFSEAGVRELCRVISCEFQKLTMDITTCGEQYINTLKSRGELKRATSPSHLVIRTLLHVSQLSTDGPSTLCQELGLLAWTTLLKLASSYNPQHLGIPDSLGNYADPVFYKARDDIIDTLQLPLFDRKDDDNVLFSELLTHNSRQVEKYLKRETKLKEITFRIVPGNNNQDYARFTVKGTRYSIERIKDVVVMDDFFDAVVTDRPSLSSF